VLNKLKRSSISITQSRLSRSSYQNSKSKSRESFKETINERPKTEDNAFSTFVKHNTDSDEPSHINKEMPGLLDL